VSEAQATQLATGHYVVRLRAEFSRTQFISATSDVLKLAVRTELSQLLQKAVV
jgi:ribonuclease P protein component